MEYLLILNTFRIPRSSLDIQDGIYEKTISYQLSAITNSLQPSFASLIRYAEGGGRADALLPGG